MIEYVDDPAYDIGDVGCSLPDLRPLAFVVGAVVVAAALVVVLVNRLRPW